MLWMPMTTTQEGPKILAVGTANPKYSFGQDAIKNVARQHFTGMSQDSLERLLGVYENTGIQKRYWAQPLEWYTAEPPPSFAQRNALSVRLSIDLAAEAASQALNKSNVSAKQVSAVVFVTSAALATPSLDAYFMQRMGIPPQATRLPIWGLGCAGGAAGLARAAELAATREYVLMVAVELCTLTFVPSDHSKSNLVASSLFADGAAAVLLGPGEGPQITGAFSRLLPDSFDVMGWDVILDGLKVRFAQSIPALIEGRLGEIIRGGLAQVNLQGNIDSWVLHPGGAKVLAAYKTALDVDEPSLEASRYILQHYGNMSSPTVLFVLGHMLSSLKGTSVLLALGPGFSAEGLVIEA
jgi:alkylresorcinol/alkylpyrone synthase